MLTIIGLGLDDGEITLKGLEALENADKAYAEFYTNTKTVDLSKLEERTETKIEELSREEVEQSDTLIEEAKNENVCFMVSGDPLTATTHYDIKFQAKKSGIPVEVIHAPSILTSVAETGLNVYKFGRVVTLPKEGKPDSILEMIEKNDSVGLHTLILLDIDYPANEAAEKLITMEEELSEREVIVVERANHSSTEINRMKMEKLRRTETGDTPHCIILTGEKSFKEEEYISAF